MRQLAAILLQILGIFRIALVIVLDLVPQILASVADEMAVVKGFDADLQCQCNKKADRDHQQLK